MKERINHRRKVRRSESENPGSNNGKVLLYVGIAVFVAGATQWFFESTNRYRYGYTIFWISFGIMIVGLSLVYVATRRSVQAKAYREYYDMIYQNEIFTISELATYADKDRDLVLSELKTLVKLGYLKNIRVSETSDHITGAFVNSVKEQIKRKTVRCGGCGAHNEVVEHQTTECEYCGRKLTYESY